MARSASRFARGSAVYKCRCCERSTRQTGRGDNDLAGVCAECFDLGGEENHLSDNGTFYNGPAEVLRLIAEVAAKGGDASHWNELKAKAEAASQPKTDLPPAAPADKIAAPLNQPTKKVTRMKIAAAILTAAAAMLAARDAETLKEVAPADLLEFYNAHCTRFLQAEPVEKFAKRATAEKKALELAEAIVAASKAEPAAKKAEPISDADRAAAISKTWADPAVREARTARHQVKSGGVVYASVRKAFDALGIDQNQRQKFRRLLVAEGKGEIAGHKFALVTGAA